MCSGSLIYLLDLAGRSQPWRRLWQDLPTANFLLNFQTTGCFGRKVAGNNSTCSLFLELTLEELVLLPAPQILFYHSAETGS
jgi:hypothetical protein